MRRWAQVVGALLLAVVISCLNGGEGLADRLKWRDDRAPAPWAETTAELSVLSYNVEGLPGWVTGTKTKKRMRAIGRLAGAYDIALFQESYVGYGALAKAAPHALVARGNGARSSLMDLVPYFCGSCGSGLGIFANIAREDFIELEREPFGNCHGWLSDEKDCWANKGFMRLRLLAAGQPLDIYTLHLEAGYGRKDERVRAKQLAELHQVIAQRSAGLPVIVAGDFNLRFDRPEDRALLTRFLTDLGLADALATDAGRAEHGRVDHIFYRSDPGLALAVLAAGPAPGFERKGKPLSNHPPYAARFGVTPRP